MAQATLLLAAIGVLPQVTILYNRLPAHEGFIRSVERVNERGCEGNPSYWHLQDIHARYRVRFVESTRWREFPVVLVGSAELGELHDLCPCGTGLLELHAILMEWDRVRYFNRHWRYLREKLGYWPFRRLVREKIRAGEVPDGFNYIWLTRDGQDEGDEP